MKVIVKAGITVLRQGLYFYLY